MNEVLDRINGLLGLEPGRLSFSEPCYSSDDFTIFRSVLLDGAVLNVKFSGPYDDLEIVCRELAARIAAVINA